MFILQLNPMTANAERVNPVAWAETREQLEAFLRTESVEPYKDGSWYCTYRPDGPLRWYNAPGPNGEVWIDVPAIVNVGTEADWMRDASERFNALKSGLFSAP